MEPRARRYVEPHPLTAADGWPPTDPRPHRSKLRVRFASAEAAARFPLALASLLGDAAELFVEDGTGREDVIALESLLQRLRRGSVQAFDARGALPADLSIERSGSEVAVRTSVDLTSAAAPRWLQASVEHTVRPAVVAVDTTSDGLSMSGCDAIVGVARRLDGFDGAELDVGGDRVRWSPSSFDGAVALTPTSGGRWRAGDGERAELWRSEAVVPAPLVDATWWSRLEELAEHVLDAPAETLEHLRPLVEGIPMRICGLESAPQCADLTPPEVGVAVRLVPTPTDVTIALRPDLTAGEMSDALVHAATHVGLGHVRPGDVASHWDTLEGIRLPHRQWDLDVRDALAALRPRRTVSSLDECTAHERALLGLHRMIGEMLGESRQLHRRAVEYQSAVYQRQAAERLVSMLEDHGGGLLCDGVGLGKTYVATTVIVHYANEWRERMARRGRSEVPFRITVLAPGSVVSTWQREALPSMAPFGVPLASVRVLSHSRLSRITPKSEVLMQSPQGLSDLQHLLLSDLVVVDEAHNFRSFSASRTKVLRDLLRMQPRKDQRRRVVLLTATPINNGLEDLRQETSLLFSKPTYPVDVREPEPYRAAFEELVADRCRRASRARTKGDVSALIAHGDREATFSDKIEFREDLSFGPYVRRIGDYLKEQDKRLRSVQERVRAAARGAADEASAEPVRVAEELLDRVVVQRSRALCKEIERQQGTATELLFRPDAAVPEKLLYADEYDGIADVLSRFLPLFDEETSGSEDAERLSFKVYMWYDVREGLKSPRETSPVVGLQRVMALKRLESSPVAFLITLLRLTALHALRLRELHDLCLAAKDRKRCATIEAELATVWRSQARDALAKLVLLSAGGTKSDARDPTAFVKCLAGAHASRSAGDLPDVPVQLTFGLADGEEPASAVPVQLERLWELREDLLRDFSTLLAVTPPLADVIFGKFSRDQWPKRFAADGASIDWPRSPEWGLRLVTDAKVRPLITRLLEARRDGQKAIVFSQFSDTIAYLQSVLDACSTFAREHWSLVTTALGASAAEVRALLAATGAITGATEDRDEAVNAFAPFYRIGPFPPVEGGELIGGSALLSQWEEAWAAALERPVDILFSTDVLAEGVNLQDAALLVNFDVHWNPVRMIQRAGRIDRRLNPRIERAPRFPELAELCARLGYDEPRYWWHDHASAAPQVVNMILPDELETELLLRERIATKTLAIDFTLGLEQGTGAEADWMAEYKYQGISSLNSFQKDRAIEQIASHQERLTRTLAESSIEPSWGSLVQGWFRVDGAGPASPLVARARLTHDATDGRVFTRYLTPVVADGVPHWMWGGDVPRESLLNFWIALDGRTWPAHVRKDLPWRSEASEPLTASHLLAATEALMRSPAEELPLPEVAGAIQQGVTAISAGYYGDPEDRERLVQGEGVLEIFLLQGVASMRAHTVPPPNKSNGRSPEEQAR